MQATNKTEQEKIWNKNEKFGQPLKIFVFNISYLILTAILSVAVWFLNKIVYNSSNSFLILLTIFIICIIFYYLNKFFKKLPYVSGKNYFIFCFPLIIILTALVWLTFFILRFNESVPDGDYLFAFFKIKEWMSFPLSFSLISGGFLILSSIYLKRCPFCQRMGIGIASKRIYTIVRITREHVETKKQKVKKIKNDEEKQSEVIEYFYTDYYQDFEYRIYRHYCSICGHALFEEMVKVKIGKKHQIPEFLEEEKQSNSAKIANQENEFIQKEQLLINKINKTKTKTNDENTFIELEKTPRDESIPTTDETLENIDENLNNIN